MEKSQWTKYNGEPVYWLAPEFWDPKTGIIRLCLPGEKPEDLSPAERIKRSVEFLTLQGDTRYCSPEVAARMRRLMRERLGTDTPWRDVEPRNAAEPADPPPPAQTPVMPPFA